ncbi:MAG: class I SAM-dependent methyltransferase [Parachlamydiales bacterium]|jgi:SAM-dependent methyltransferase
MKKKSLSEKTCSNNNSQKVFTNIYKKGIWGKNENGRNYSGIGSTIRNTSFYIIFMEHFIRSNNIRSVLDVGCGDWSFSKYMDWKGISYLGVDVVKSIVIRNKKEFSQNNIKFSHIDAVNSDLPPADLMICKDVLQHLSYQDIKLFLKQITKFKYCLITNDIDPKSQSNNSDITTGGYRPLDLTKKPFNLNGIKIFTYRSNLLKQVLLLENTSL